MFNNPYYFDQAKKNMTPDNFKMASEKLSSMSDEELRNMSKMTGLNISPEMLKTSANMFKNMNPDEIERMKNMSAGMNFNNFNNNSQNFAQNPSYPFNDNKNTTNPPETLKKSKTDPFESNEKPLLFPKIENLKKKGNDFFNKNQYDEASSSYLEAILEIEEVKMNEGKYDKEEIKRLDIACRLNYATTKAKLNEYEIVLIQAREVLKYGDNGKAFFRVGQALHHLGRNEKALINLESALKYLPNDSIVVSYLEKVREVLSDKNKENSTPQQTEEKKEEVPIVKPQLKTNEPQEKIIRNDNPPPQEERKEKIKKKNVNLESINLQEEIKPKLVEKKEVLIEEEKTVPTTQKPLPQQNTQIKPPSNFPNDPNKLNQAKQSAEQLKNMSPDQMKMMTDYFKQMDNSFLKDMMKQQSGVEMSESELENLKNMINPEMLQMMSGMNFDNMTMPSMGGMPSQPMGTINTNQNVNVSSQPSMTQNIGNLMQNKDMINGMMENMKKNPEMLKSMGKMLGDNHPLSGVLNRSSPEDLQKMMNVMQILINVFAKISSLISWMRRNIKLVGFVVVMMIIYYFYF